MTGKVLRVIPLFIKGRKSHVKNYRPVNVITLASNITVNFEKYYYVQLDKSVYMVSPRGCNA